MSHSILELHGPKDSPRPFWQGIVHSAPVDLSDKIDVIVPDFDPNLVWRSCYWMSRDATTMPAPGDRCIVALDHLNEPWVLAWWPF